MVTIIIPTYHEKENIEKIERELQKLNGTFQVIFTDGFSTDGTFEKITYPKIQEAKYRANQMNAAVSHAKGDLLWFVHADSRLHPDSISAIEESSADAGCFTLRFDSNHPLMKIEERCSNLRVKWRKIAFGDQGIFIKREIFERLGGFRPIPLMEDYQLSMDLKREKIPICQLPVPIVTSARRFEKNGILKTIWKMQVLQHRYRKNEDIWDITKDYGD